MRLAECEVPGQNRQELRNQGRGLGMELFINAQEIICPGLLFHHHPIWQGQRSAVLEEITSVGVSKALL